MFQFYNYSELFKPEEIIDYLRKSRSDDPTLTVEEVLSKHEAMLDEWSERYLGAKVPLENKYREVVSGETIADRPEFQKVLKLIESPKYKAIKVVEVQRLSRGDLEDAGRLMKLLRYTSTYIITPQKLYDLNNEYDRDLFERELKRGNEYLEYTKKIMNNGRLLSVSQGNYVGNTAPYGYNKAWVMDGKRKCPTLSINEEQAAVVKTIFDLYANKNMGMVNICHYLDSIGVKPPKGEYWSSHTIKGILSNVHYIGKVRWNWRKTKMVVEDGEVKSTRPRAAIEDQLIYDGKHDAIISEEIFQAVQEKQGRNHRAKNSTKLRNPFAGLVFCRCGRAMTLRTYRTKDGSEKNPPRLLCEDQVHCKSGSCRFDEMLVLICDILEKNIADFEVKINGSTDDVEKSNKRIIKALEKRQVELRNKEIAQWEAQSNPDISQRMPPDIFKILNEKLQREKEDVEKAIQKAQATATETANYEERISRFKNALDALKNSETDAEAKNRLLKACIERIEYFKQRPERVTNPEKKVNINGRKVKPHALTVGGKWTNPPISLEVKLKA